jgi:hypothetical protein
MFVLWRILICLWIYIYLIPAAACAWQDRAFRCACIIFIFKISQKLLYLSCDMLNYLSFLFNIFQYVHHVMEAGSDHLEFEHFIFTKQNSK